MDKRQKSKLVRLFEPFAILGVFLVMGFTYYTATNLSPATLPGGRASVLGVATPNDSTWKLTIPGNHPVFTSPELKAGEGRGYQLQTTLNLERANEVYTISALEVANRTDRSSAYKISTTVEPEAAAITLRLRLQQTSITIFNGGQATQAQLTVPARTGQVLHLEVESPQSGVTPKVTLDIEALE